MIVIEEVEPWERGWCTGHCAVCFQTLSVFFFFFFNVTLQWRGLELPPSLLDVHPRAAMTVPVAPVI